MGAGRLAVVGTSQIEVRENLGRVLNVSLPGEGAAQILIQEAAWNQVCVRQGADDVDYVVVLPDEQSPEQKPD